MSSSWRRVVVLIPYRSVDGDLADTIDSVVAQTHEHVECQVLTDPDDAAGIQRAWQCAGLYPGHGIGVGSRQIDAAIHNTAAHLVLLLRPGQILRAGAIAELVWARHQDQALSVVFSQPDQPDLPDLSGLTRQPPEFECALYARDALLACGGLDATFDDGYATWDLWVRLVAAGHHFRRLAERCLAEVHGVHRKWLWTLSLDPAGNLDLGQWARLVQKNHKSFRGARVELAAAILEQGCEPQPELRTLLIQALQEDGWPEAARPHVEVLLRDGGQALLPGAQAWLAHIQGLCQFACGRHNEAAESFRRVLAVQPAHAESHGMLARIAQAEGDHATALRHAEDALELEPAPRWRQLVQALEGT